MCVVYHVIAKCKCLVRVFIDSIHWFDSLLRFLTSIHWFDSLIRFITSIDWSLRSLEFKAANQCSDLLDPLKKSPDAYSIEFRLFHVASAASWVASPSPVCSSWLSKTCLESHGCLCLCLCPLHCLCLCLCLCVNVKSRWQVSLCTSNWVPGSCTK